MQNPFQLIVLPDTFGFGSFNTYLLHVLDPIFYFPKEGGKRKKITLTHRTMPEAKGYWWIGGRRHEITYKKKLIAVIFTEDCGLGSAKVRKALEHRGFRIA